MSRADGQLKIAVLISGRGSNMQALAHHAGKLGTGYEICLVAANKPADGLAVASDAGLPTTLIDRKNYTSKKEHENALADAIEASGASWICLAGYMAVLSADFIARFVGKIINIHPSLLPDYKGLHTHERALADNQKFHGVSVHLVTPVLDDGAVIAQMRLSVQHADTSESLSARVLVLEHILYPLVIGALASGAVKLDAGQVHWHDTSSANALCLPEDTALIFG
jgi:phosphoribosylglycinamide formyltransferase-1